MSKLTYYFPFLIGIILGPVIAYFKLTELWATASEGRQLLTIPFGLLLGLLGALFLQLLMVGFQGMSAGAVPVYRGRSIRGTPAAVIGLFILIWGAASCLIPLSGMSLRQLPTGWFWFVLIVWLTSLIGFVGTYLWCIPNAVRDFVDEPL